MKYFKATYSNGYCGCDESIYIKAETEIEAIEVTEEDIENYSFYEPDSRFVNEPEDYDDEDEYWEAVEEYHDNVSIAVNEITREEYEENVKE